MWDIWVELKQPMGIYTIRRQERTSVRQSIRTKLKSQHLALGVLVAMGLFLGLRLTTDFETLISQVPDDAFYFFEVAHHLSETGVSTFDTLHETNGYQPLWMVCLLPLYHIFAGDLIRPVQAALWLQWGLALLALGLVYDAVARTTRPAVGLAVLAVLSFPQFTQRITNGMESALLLLMASGVLWVILRRCALAEDAPLRARLLLGGMLGLLALARLDSVFLWLILGSYLIGQTGYGSRDVRRFFRRGVSIFGPALALVTPYLLWNVVHFGHLMPISGVYKNTFPQLHFMPIFYSLFRVPACIAGLGVTSPLVYLLLRHRHRRRGTTLPNAPLGPALIVFGGGVVLHWLHTVCFMQWAVFDWHFTLYGVFAALWVAWVGFALAEELPFRARPDWPRRGLALVLVGLTLVGHGLVWRRWTQREINNSFIVQGYRISRWVNTHTSPQAIFAMCDAGAFAYFVDRPVINLDGLVNDFEYYSYVRRQAIDEYLQREKVDYVVQHAVYADLYPQVEQPHYDMRGWNKKHLEWMDLRRLNHETEVYRSSLYWDSAHPSYFMIWKISENPGPEKGWGNFSGE